MKKTASLVASFVLAAASLAGCDGQDISSNAVNEIIGTSDSVDSALVHLRNEDGIYYIFDFKNNKASLAITDDVDFSWRDGSRKTFYTTKSLGEFPAIINKKFIEVKETLSGRGNVNTATIRVSNDDPGFNNNKKIAYVVSDPLSQLVCVIDTNVSYTRHDQLEGDCRSLETWPVPVQEIAKNQLGLDTGPK